MVPDHGGQRLKARLQQAELGGRGGCRSPGRRPQQGLHQPGIAIELAQLAPQVALSWPAVSSWSAAKSASNRARS
jgi:hypothetical protein